jgi:hypothetical protein
MTEGDEMPKPQTVARERFRIIAETSLQLMGPILATLTKMGLENISYELIEEVDTFRRNGSNGAAREIGSIDFALNWMADHPTFRVKEIKAHFVANGWNASSAYSAVSTLCKDGKLVKLEGGNYRRFDVKEIEAPQPPPRTRENAAGATGSTEPENAAPVRYDVSNTDLVWLAIGRRKIFDTTSVKQLFRDRERNVGSVSPTLHAMQSKSFLKRLGDGRYEVVNRPTKQAEADHHAQ